MADRSGWNAAVLFISLAVLAATLVLTYATEYFASFQGSWLVVLAWFLLAAAALTALAIKRTGTHRLHVPRNVTFVLGIAVILISMGLAIWANNMFSWL